MKLLIFSILQPITKLETKILRICKSALHIFLISSSHWILRRGEIRTGQVSTVMDNVRMVFNSPASWGSAATYIFAESVRDSPIYLTFR